MLSHLKIFFQVFCNAPKLDCLHWLLTMASIAVTRSVGHLLFRYNMNSSAKRIFNPVVASFACLGIWILTFIIISPITFSMNIGPYSFGTFGYDKKFGKCDAVHCHYKDGFIPAGMIIGVGFFAPSAIIIISHIFISIILEKGKRKTEKILNKSQVEFVTGFKWETNRFCRY